MKDKKQIVYWVLTKAMEETIAQTIVEKAAKWIAVNYLEPCIIRTTEH